MVYTIVLFVWRKPGMTPEQFKQYYETRHVPLIASIAGDSFPLTHARRYVQRTATADAADASKKAYPATVLVGKPEDFSYDSYAELTFEDEAHFQRFFGICSEPENRARLAADEEQFSDGPKMTIAVLGETMVASRPTR